jgi:hypothetical protein
VVKVGDIARLADIAGLQSYVINGSKVVFLRRRPQPRPPKGAVGASQCVVCTRHLQVRREAAERGWSMPVCSFIEADQIVPGWLKHKLWTATNVPAQQISIFACVSFTPVKMAYPFLSLLPHDLRQDISLYCSLQCKLDGQLGLKTDAPPHPASSADSQSSAHTNGPDTPSMLNTLRASDSGSTGSDSDITM